MARNTFLLSVALFTLFAGSLQGQATPAVERKVLFTCVDWDNANLQNLYFLSEEEYRPIQLRENRRSRQYHYSGEPIFRLYTKEAGEAGEPAYRQVAQLDLAGLPDQILLLLAAGDASPVRIYALADTLEHFPAGSYSLMNLTDTALDVRIDGRPLHLAGRGREVVLPGGEAYRSLPVAVAAGERQAYRSTWVYEPALRKVVFFLPRYSGGQVEGLEVRVIPEVIAQPAAAER